MTLGCRRARIPCLGPSSSSAAKAPVPPIKVDHRRAGEVLHVEGREHQPPPKISGLRSVDERAEDHRVDQVRAELDPLDRRAQTIRGAQTAQKTNWKKNWPAPWRPRTTSPEQCRWSFPGSPCVPANQPAPRMRARTPRPSSTARDREVPSTFRTMVPAFFIREKRSQAGGSRLHEHHEDRATMTQSSRPRGSRLSTSAATGPFARRGTGSCRTMASVASIEPPPGPSFARRTGFGRGLCTDGGAPGAKRDNAPREQRRDTPMDFQLDDSQRAALRASATRSSRASSASRTRRASGGRARPTWPSTPEVAEALIAGIPDE